MAIELCEEKIKLYKPLNGVVVKTVVDSDVIVPDVKPDVIKILQANAVASVNEKFVQKDMITVSGFVDYTVLYLSENEDKINTIRTKCPFTHRIEITGTDDDCMNYVICDVAHVEFGIYNSRKINLKSVICFETDVVGNSVFNAVSSISSSVNIPQKNKNIKFLNMAVCEAKNFIINDEISLSSTESEIEIIKIDNNVSVKETKSMNDKLVLKGDLNIEILYLNDGDISHFNCDIPFTEVFDAEGLSPQMHTSVKCNLSSEDFGISTTEEGTLMSYEGTVDVAIKAYEEKNYDLITDVYSPDYEIAINKADIDCIDVTEFVTKSFTLNETVTIDEKHNIEKVYNFYSKPVIDSVVGYNGYCITNGYADIKVLYSEDENTEKIHSLNSKVPFSFKIESSQIDTNTIINQNMNLLHSGYVLKSGKDIEIRMLIELDNLFCKEAKYNVLSGLEIDETRKINKNNQSGITIYYADEKEDLWDIAKRYNTTVDEILSLNGLDENSVLKNRQQLLIAKRIVN